MLGFNEIESILVNREDEKYHAQMEGQARNLPLNTEISEVRIILTLKT